MMRMWYLIYPFAISGKALIVLFSISLSSRNFSLGIF